MDVVFVTQRWLLFCKQLCICNNDLHDLISSWMHSLCKWVFVHSEQSLRGRSLQLQPPIFHLPSKCDAHRQLRPVHWKLSFRNWLVEFCEVAPRRALLAHWWGNRYRVAKSYLSDDRVARCGRGHGDRGRSWEVTRVQQMGAGNSSLQYWNCLTLKEFALD